MTGEIAQIQPDNQSGSLEPVREKSWVKGALKRGFFSAVQGFYAGNLSLIRFVPGTALSKTQEKLAHKIEYWEDKIQKNDIEPENPGFLKSGLSFLLFNSTYVLPVLATGVTTSLVGGSSFAAIAAAGAFNAHAMMGEAFVKTVRKHIADLEEPKELQEILGNKEFNRTATINTSAMGAVFFGVSLAVGPLARLLGGVTSGVFQAVSRIPVLGAIVQPFYDLAHRSAVKMGRKPLGRLFAHAARKGTTYFDREGSAPIYVMSTRVDEIPALGQYFPREPVGEHDDEPVIEVILMPEPDTAKADHVPYPLEPGQ